MEVAKLHCLELRQSLSVSRVSVMRFLSAVLTGASRPPSVETGKLTVEEWARDVPDLFGDLELSVSDYQWAVAAQVFYGALPGNADYREKEHLSYWAGLQQMRRSMFAALGSERGEA